MELTIPTMFASLANSFVISVEQCIGTVHCPYIDSQGSRATGIPSTSFTNPYKVSVSCWWTSWGKRTPYIILCWTQMTSMSVHMLASQTISSVSGIRGGATGWSWCYITVICKSLVKVLLILSFSARCALTNHYTCTDSCNIKCIGERLEAGSSSL